ncbi:MAG TPA: hypothetical protein VF306_12965 [Pirellulales bacterium]
MPNEPSREAEFLQWQADQAKAAFDQTFEEFKQSLRDSAKLRVWARRHPWAVTGAAAAGGFLLAKMVFSPSQPEPSVRESPPSGNGQPHENTPEPRRHRYAWLLTPLWEIVQPMLGQVIGSLLGAIAGAAGASAAGMTAQSHGDASTEDGAGDADHHPAEGPVPF